MATMQLTMGASPDRYPASDGTFDASYDEEVCFSENQPPEREARERLLGCCTCCVYRVNYLMETPTGVPCIVSMATHLISRLQSISVSSIYVRSLFHPSGPLAWQRGE